MQTVEWRKACDCEGAEHKAGLWRRVTGGTVRIRVSVGPICQRCGIKWTPVQTVQNSFAVRG